MGQIGELGVELGVLVGLVLELALQSNLRNVLFDAGHVVVGHLVLQPNYLLFVVHTLFVQLGKKEANLNII